MMERMGWHVLPALVCALALCGTESVRGQEDMMETTMDTPWCQTFVDDSQLTVVAVRYSFEDVEMQGVVAYQTDMEGPRPVVMVAHDWNGLDQYEVWRAKYLAMQGYVGFAIDTYGAEIPVGDDLPIPQRQELIGATFGNATRTEGMLNAAVDVAQGLEMGDGRLAVVGYCYGGTISLDLARLGLVDGAGAFHVGNILTTPVAPEFSAGAAPVSVWNGYEDSITAEDYKSLMETLETAGGLYEVTLFSDTVHSFTEPSGPLLLHEPDAGAAYSPYADARSFDSALKWLQGVFEQPMDTADTGGMDWPLPSTAMMAARAADAPAVEELELSYTTPDDASCVSTGYYMASATGKLPVVFVMPDMGSDGTFEMDRAMRLADAGYMAVMVDLACGGVEPTTASMLRSHIQAAVDAVLDTPAAGMLAETTQMAAIGFGTGGNAALDIARNSEAPAITGVIAIDADAFAPLPGATALEAEACLDVAVVALQSYANSGVTDAEIAAWQEELSVGGVRWQYTYYGSDVPKDFYTGDGTYAVERSWGETMGFLALLFADEITPPVMCVMAGPAPEADPVPETCSVPECDEACMMGEVPDGGGMDSDTGAAMSACDGDCVARFAKCAEDDGLVSPCCEADDMCIRKNAFYSQCITEERLAANMMTGEWSGEDLTCTSA